MRQIIKRLSLAVITGCMAGGLSGLAQARPLIIEETSRIDPPDAFNERFGRRVAIDGEHERAVPQRRAFERAASL